MGVAIAVGTDERKDVGVDVGVEVAVAVGVGAGVSIGVEIDVGVVSAEQPINRVGRSTVASTNKLIAGIFMRFLPPRDFQFLHTASVLSPMKAHSHQSV